MLNTLKANETRVCPTLIVFWNRAHLKELAQAGSQLPRKIAPALKAFWDSQLKDFSPDLRVPAILVSARRANTKLLSQAQIPLLAGTDLGFAYVRPGDLLKELGLLVEAGLSPAEALRAATVNAAVFMNRSDELGTVEKGKIADLVLLDANPLNDIHAVERINAVIANGRFLAREYLLKEIPRF